MTEQLNDEGVTAVLGLVVHHFGDEVRLPASILEDGLPPNAFVRVDTDSETNEIVVRIVEGE